MFTEVARPDHTIAAAGSFREIERDRDAAGAGRHPAVGFIIGTMGDACSGGQFIGFSGVLIGPDVFLTSADIAFETQRHLDSNFFDTAWVILDPEPLVAPTTPVALDCTKFIRVVGIFVNPVYQSDPDRNEGDVGVLRLESPQTVPVADLPAAGRDGALPKPVQSRFRTSVRGGGSWIRSSRSCS